MKQVPFTNRPTEAQMLLLRAALDPPTEAVAAWREWRRTTVFDDAGAEQFKLLPLVAGNLPPDALDSEVAGRMRGLRRMAWSRNQMLFHASGRAIAALEGAGIRTFVIKGAALAHLAYADLRARTMADVDVMVPPDRATEALEVLAAEGWASTYADPEARLRVHHSVEVSKPPGGEIDLHWQSLWLAADDAPLWEAAVPLELGGTPTLAPSPADSLLIVCAHGLPWSPGPAVGWIADAVTLIRSAEGGPDWARLRSEARRRRLSAWVGVPLRFLREEMGCEEVPGDVIAALEADPMTREERAGLVQAMKPDSPLRTYRMARDRHRRLLAMRSPGTPPAFHDFARDFWGVTRTAELAVRAARGARRAAGARLSDARGSARSAS